MKEQDDRDPPTEVEPRAGRVPTRDIENSRDDLKRLLRALEIYTIRCDASGVRRVPNSSSASVLSAIHAEVLPRFWSLAEKLFFTPSERRDPDFDGPRRTKGGHAMVEGGGDPRLFAAARQVTDALDNDPRRSRSGVRNRYLMNDVIGAEVLAALQSSAEILDDYLGPAPTRKRRGRRQRFDPVEDRRLVENRNASGMTRQEFERARGIDERSVRKAQDREKKRKSRGQ